MTLNYQDENIPPEFRHLTEAFYWANEYIQASELEDRAILSQAVDWFARAMDAARSDEREVVMRELADNGMIEDAETEEEATG